MVNCVQIMKENSQAFFYNLKKTDFTLKKATKGYLLENDGSILCLKTTDVDVTRVLLAQVLINLEEDSILNDNNLNEILFTDFSSFTTLTSEQNKDFLKNFPDLLVCILDNEQEFSKQSQILESWINIIKVNKGKKIIFIMKNSKHLENIIMDNRMANIFKLKLDKLRKNNEILSNNGVICEVGNNSVNIESTSASALDECMDINLNEEESGGKTLSHSDFSFTENAHLMNLLQSLIVKELNAADEHGNTQLHLAARDGKTEIVESLLVHGAKKDVENNDGETALHLAAQKGHSAIVQIMLLEHGFDVNATDLIQRTPLHYACSHNNDVHLIAILLKFGAEIESKDKYNRTALHCASWNGRSAVVNLLLENGANINAQDNQNLNTPLHEATFNNQQEVVLILLQHGALLDIKNKLQQNALDVARSCPWNRTEIIQILENHKSCHHKRNKVIEKKLKIIVQDGQ